MPRSYGYPDLSATRVGTDSAASDIDDNTLAAIWVAPGTVALYADRVFESLCGSATARYAAA